MTFYYYYDQVSSSKSILIPRFSNVYIYTLNEYKSIVCTIGSKRLSVRESRGSRSGRGGAIVLSRNSLLFQRHATDRSRQEEQSRVPGTRGMDTQKKKKKKISLKTF